jgi:hypothetical protein
MYLWIYGSAKSINNRGATNKQKTMKKQQRAPKLLDRYKTSTHIMGKLNVLKQAKNCLKNDIIWIPEILTKITQFYQIND